MAVSFLSSLPILLILSLFNSVMPVRLDLTHIDAAGNFTKLEIFSRAVLRNKHHLTTFAEARIPVHPSRGEYLIDLAIGTPGRKFSAILDTGSDLIWTQCTPCTKCMPQPTPLFDPSQSSTYSKILCNTTLCDALPKSSCLPECHYDYSYADGFSTGGVLASEKFTFGSETAHVGFGCGSSNQGDMLNASGVVGLGQGPLSLISQLGVREFSYCFTSFADAKPSPLFLGSKLNSSTIGRNQIKPTPLLKLYPNLYGLSLLGITVGDTRLRTPEGFFELKENGRGGFFIDSGTTITYLETAVYELVRKEFLFQVKLPLGNALLSSNGLDLCFSLPADSVVPELPKLVFHFEGADWEMTRENYMLHDSGLLCLTIMGLDGISVLGNLQQQNTYIQYDLENEMLWFAPTQCNQL